MKDKEKINNWLFILTIVLIITFVLLIFSIGMLIKLEAKVYGLTDYSVNNFEWIEKLYTKISKLEYKNIDSIYDDNIVCDGFYCYNNNSVWIEGIGTCYYWEDLIICPA